MLKNKTIMYKKFSSIDEILEYVHSVPKAEQKVVLVDCTPYLVENGGMGINITNPAIDTNYFCYGNFEKINADESSDIKYDGWYDNEGEGFFKVKWENEEENFYIANTLGYITDIEDKENTNSYTCCNNPNVISIDDSIKECQNCLTIFSTAYELPTSTNKKAKKITEERNLTFIEV